MRVLSFETKKEPILSRRRFCWRLFKSFVVMGLVVLLCMGIGICGYHYTENLEWLDALLDAAMILTGEGPVHQMHTSAGKIFASGYALFSSVAFITLVALIMMPVLHRVLHHFHLEAFEEE